MPTSLDAPTAVINIAPLPELTLSNLTVNGACPDYTANFEVQNTGCVVHQVPGPGPNDLRDIEARDASTEYVISITKSSWRVNRWMSNV